MEKFLEFNLGNVLTIISGFIGLVTIWVKMKDKVDLLGERQIESKIESKEHFEKVEKAIDEIKTTGSPSSRTAIMVMNSRIDSQGQRLQEVERAVVQIASMAADMKWISTWVQKQMSKEQ